MDNNKAKPTLAVYRPNGSDANDPFFAEALQQVEKDPTLREWFAEQQRFDADFIAALGSIKGPSEGRALIEATMMKRPGRRVRWWPLALAASIAILLAVGFGLGRNRPLPLPENASPADLAANLSEHHASIGFMSMDIAKLRAWISDRGGPLPEQLPPGLGKLAVLGCQTWNTTRGKISLLCFIRDDKQMVHLYVFENSRDNTSLPDISAPRVDHAGMWSLASWKERNCTLVLGVPASAGGDETLRALFRA